MHMNLAHRVGVIVRVANPVMVMREAMGCVRGIAERQDSGRRKHAQRVKHDEDSRRPRPACSQPKGHRDLAVPESTRTNIANCVIVAKWG